MASQIEKETLLFCNGGFRIVGAVFNRDFPGNRGRRPLPPAINFYLNELEYYEVSYKDLAPRFPDTPGPDLTFCVSERYDINENSCREQ